MASRAFQTGVLRVLSMKTTPSVARQPHSPRSDSMREASNILAAAWNSTGAVLSQSIRDYDPKR